MDDDLPVGERAELALVLGGPVFFLYSSTADLVEGFDGAQRGEGSPHAPQPGEATALLDATQVELPQAGMALAYALHLDRSVDDVAREMGLAVSRFA